MNGFEKLKERLEAEGWYVGWNLPCCQTCAWDAVPDNLYNGKEVDFAKVLFNHSQDCEYEPDCIDCEKCDGDGLTEEGNECPDCEGVGYIHEDYDSSKDFDLSVSGFICLKPKDIHGSSFCFDGSDEGVENLTAVLPIIEECGCKIRWNGTGDARPYISWD